MKSKCRYMTNFRVNIYFYVVLINIAKFTKRILLEHSQFRFLFRMGELKALKHDLAVMILQLYLCYFHLLCLNSMSNT